MFEINKIPVIQIATEAVFDTSRVKEVRVVRVGNSICVTMIVDEHPQIYAADPKMMEYLSNTYGAELDMITAAKANSDIYEHITTEIKPKFW